MRLGLRRVREKELRLNGGPQVLHGVEIYRPAAAHCGALNVHALPIVALKLLLASSF
jgi:hypothetical protein